MRTAVRIATVGVMLAAGLAESATDEQSGTLVTEPLWGVELRFPGYREWEDHPLRGQPNLVLAGLSKSGECPLNLSLFAEIVPAGTTADGCRKDYAGNPEVLENRADVTLHEHEISPVTYTLFDEVHDERAGRFVNTSSTGTGPARIRASSSTSRASVATTSGPP